MARFPAWIAAATLLAWFAAPTIAAQTSTRETADLVRGKVVAYSSGTAFAVLDPDEKLKRIKLTGVDAPERRQRFAAQARQLASEWLGRSAIQIRVDGSDKDGRTHGRVEVDGRDVGLSLLNAGLAWCDPSDESMLPPPVRESYQAACAKAKAGRQGLWRDANPVPPWEYRKVPEFDPPPSPGPGSSRSCRDIGYQTVQCDDGTTYRSFGDEIRGSDGTVYTRRGRTLTGDDGSHFTQQGTSTYGADGTVCRSRGRQTLCY